MTSLINRNNNSKNSSTILLRIALSDQLAAKECVDVYGRMIWALAKKFTASEAEAEMAVQEIFVDIWQNAERCDLKISDEEVWIAFIARRRLSKYVVKSSIQPQVNAANNILQFNLDKTEKQLPRAN